jgi:deoxycytidylate deaminase
MRSAVVRAAIKAALRSNSRFRLGAVIYKGSIILGVGSNQMDRTHPRSPHPYLTVHSEFDAVLGVDEEKLVGASLYVHRLKKDGSTGSAQPCEHCTRMLKAVGIRRVDWSG